MRRCAFLLVVLLAAPARAQGAAPPGPYDGPLFPRALTRDVFGDALGFIAPRTLDPVPMPQLALWGLRGLEALDPALATELRPDGLLLTRSGRPLYTVAVPGAGADDWAAAAAVLAEIAWDSSASVREAGPATIVRSFFDELFNHLDPYSRYVPPAAANGDRARRSGEAGLGMAVLRRGAAVLVRSVAPDGPAAGAGIRPGDQVLAVGGRPVAALDAAAVAGMIAGPDGTTVTLSLRGRDNRPRDVEVERALVPPETVSADRLGDALVLRVSGFARDTDARLSRQLLGGMAPRRGGRPVRGVVLDLRGNRGGLLRKAVTATGIFLPAGTIAITEGRHPQASRVLRSHGEDLSNGLPVVVVVDGRTASAAEIMAAALADRGRAVVVGSSTLGKGLVQAILELPDGGELLVTWSRVLAPLGWPIQELGVLPQVCTSLGGAALAGEMAELAGGRPAMARALARHRAARAPLPSAEALEIRAACPPAEGQDVDLLAARALLADRVAYRAALLPAPAAP